MSQPFLSLVVATRGRTTPFAALFQSLDAQSFRDFEVIVVDQNSDARVGNARPGRLVVPDPPPAHARAAGASRARNAGLAQASGTHVLFPDDDCWYPPGFLADAVARMDMHNADVLAGRAADPATGRDINGRFEPDATRIDRDNVWTTGIEWVVLFKRAVLDAVGGYDPGIGVGATTPWQSCEAQDIVLRALDRGFVCVFDPCLFGHHAELDIRDPSMLRKGRAYARGFGHVLRVHRYSSRSAASWIIRPSVRALMSLAKGDFTLFAYYRNVALGRLEGWRGKVPGQGSIASSARKRAARGEAAA